MTELLRLLLVEDEPDIREITELALALDEGVDLVAFSGAWEALEHLKLNAPKIDVALLDLKMPDMSGIDLHLAIRELPAYAELCAILITASIMDINKSWPDAPGLIGVISKPFDPSKLAQRVRSLLSANSEQTSDQLRKEHARQVERRGPGV